MSATLPPLAQRLTVVDTEGEEFVDMTYTNFVSRHMVTNQVTPLPNTAPTPFKVACESYESVLLVLCVMYIQ